MRRPASTAQLELPLASEPACEPAELPAERLPAVAVVACAGCGWLCEAARCPVCGARERAATPAAPIPGAVLRLPPLRRVRRERGP